MVSPRAALRRGTMTDKNRAPAAEQASRLASSFFPTPMQLTEYFLDAGQRTVLFWDVMRRRSNQYREHLAQTAPHVLQYKVELLLDGRSLERPVNYALVRILPPPGVEVDEHRRP